MGSWERNEIEPHPIFIIRHLFSQVILNQTLVVNSDVMDSLALENMSKLLYNPVDMLAALRADPLENVIKLDLI